MTIERHDQPQDEIIAEVRANREALAAEYDYDVDRIYEAIKQGEARSGRRFIEAEPKRIKPIASWATVILRRSRKKEARATRAVLHHQKVWNHPWVECTRTVG